MRIGVNWDGRLGAIRHSALSLLVVFFALSAANLHANVILNLGSPTCTATDSPSGTVTPVCSAIDSQGTAQPNGLTGLSFGFPPANLPTTVSNNNNNTSARTTTISFSTSGVASNNGPPTTVPLGTTISFGYKFALDATNAGPNTVFNSYTVTFNIIDTLAATSVFGAAPSVTVVLPPSTQTVTANSQFTGLLTSAINSGTNYTVTAVLVVHWTAGASGVKNYFINGPFSFDIDPTLVPEPATLSLTSGTLALLALLYRRKRPSR